MLIRKIGPAIWLSCIAFAWGALSLGIGFISLAVPIYISEISREYTLLSICGPSRAYVIRNTQLLLFVVASLPYVSV